jgi:hypothetical protein
MFSYPFTKQYTLEKLNLELEAAGVPMISMDLISDTQFIVNTANQLTNEQQLTLNAVVSSHIPTSTIQDVVADKIAAARSFGLKLIAQYGAQNVLSGYSIVQIQDIMNRTAKVQAALNTGSLYVAIAELNAVETDDTIITTDKIKSFRNLIQDYLGIPRT